MSQASHERLATRPALEAFEIESGPAVFETHQGERTPGFASIVVTRASIAIRFEGPEGFVPPKAGYGESNGRLLAQDGAWSALNVNVAGKAANGAHLLSTMELVIGAGGNAALTRLVIAGADWSGDGALGGKAVVARPLSREVVSHHDRRMALAIERAVDPSEAEDIGRACSFITGIDVEVLRFEHFSADGAPLQVRHIRGYRRVGRGTHSPFTGVADEHRMRAFVSLLEAFPRLLKEGVPIDMIVDQISAHNQVAQIHVSAPLLLMATLTAAWHRLHGRELAAGAATRAPELRALNEALRLGLTEAEIARFEGLRIELLEAGFFHKPGYETGRPQKDIKFIRDISHAVVLRLCGYSGPFYGAEKFAARELPALGTK